MVKFTIETFEPEKATDSQLADDFRLLAAKYSTMKEGGKTDFKDEAQVIEFTARLLKEIYKRGALTFHPAKMEKASLELLQKAATQVVKGKIILDDAAGFASGHLTLHLTRHGMDFTQPQILTGPDGAAFGIIRFMKARRISLTEFDELEAQHGFTDEQRKASLGREIYAHQVRDYIPPTGTLAKRNPETFLEEMGKAPEQIVVCPDFLSITGSSLWAKDREPGDVDIVAKEEAHRIDSGTWLKISRLVKALFQKEAHLVAEPTGPSWENVPWFDLVLVRKNKMERRVVDGPAWKALMHKAATAETIAQAETAAKENRILPGDFFIPAKPISGHLPEQPQTVANFLALIEDEDFPVFCQKNYDGVNIQIHKVGDVVKIFSEDGVEITQALPWLADEVQKISPAKSFIILAELELWDRATHLPREAVAAFLDTKPEAQPIDPGLVANAHDVVHYDGQDIHSQPYGERLKVLDGFGFAQDTLREPDLAIKFNKVPTLMAKNKKELELVVEKLRKLPGSSGAVVKCQGFLYDLTGGRKGSIQFHNSAQLDAIVLKAHEAETPGVFVYDIGILPSQDFPAQEEVLEDYDGKKYMAMGSSFSTSQEIKPGQIITMEFETLNLEDADGKYNITARAPRFMGAASGKEPSNAVQAVDAARRGLVLAEKVVKDGEVFVKADPLQAIPDENKAWHYVVQHHFRGSSAHADFRAEQDGRLVGFTMFDLLKDALGTPVETLPQAKAADKEPGNWKINWGTGEFKMREVRGDVVRPADIRSTPKKPEPLPWLKVEGVVAPGEVGGTKEFPGVFSIVDKGLVEYGVQKPFFHEYFLDGGKLKGRLLFRQLTREEAATKKADSILPPGQAEALNREPFYWVAIQPIDQTPNVLSASAIEKRFLPPFGISALPKRMRENVPPALQYWKEKDRAKALKMRDELATFEELGGVKLQKKEEDFYLFRRWFKGQIVVRFGPSTEMWELFIVKDGRQERWVLQGNPVKEIKTGAYLEGPDAQVRLGEYKPGQAVELKPGSHLNPTKNTPAFMELLEKGTVQILDDGEDLKKVQFKGKDLNGTYIFRRDDAASPLWEMEKTTSSPLAKFSKGFSFCKVDDAQRLVYGIVYEAGPVDSQGDWTEEKDLEEAAHSFMLNLGGLNEMHTSGLSRADALPVESLVLKRGDVYKGMKFENPTWVICSKVFSEAVWQKIKSGEYTGYSMEGDAGT